MIIRCKTCGEEYDTELFPVCPYCLSTNTIDDNEESSDEVLQNTDDSSCINCFNEVPAIQAGSSSINNTGDLHQINGESTKDSNSLDSSGEMDAKELNDKYGCIYLSEIEGLSTRAKNVFYRNDLVTLSDLLHFVDNNDLSELRNIGKKTVEEINAVIKRTASLYLESKKREAEQKPKEIKDVFAENKYRLFVEYCSKNGLIYLDELATFDFDVLYAVRGMGANKVADIKNKFNIVYPSSLITMEVKDKNDRVIRGEYLFDNTNEQLQSASIDLLNGLGISVRQCEELKNSSIETIGDLEHVTVPKLSIIVGRNNIDKYRAVSKMLQNGLTELFASVLESFSEDKRYEATLLKAEGYTLQEIGNSLGVTRERIRQLIVKFLRIIDPYMDSIVKPFFDSKGYVSVQEILDIYDNDDYDKILIYWCKNSGHVIYVEYADSFLPGNTDIEAIEAGLNSYAEEFVGDGVSVSEKLDDISNILQEPQCFFLDEESFIDYMLCHGYKMYGDFIIRGRQSYGALCERIIAKKFKDGIKLYDSNDLDLLRKYALSEYGDIGLSKENRALTARITEFLVLRGRGEYIAEENVRVEPELLEELKDYIDEQPEAEIYYSDIYAHFEGMINMMSNIDNYNFLHGVLKLYFAEEYDFSNRDYLTKQGDNLLSGRLDDRLRNYIERQKRPVSKKEIKNKFPGVTDVVLATTLAYSEALLQWDYSYYTSMDIINISDADKQYLLESIVNIMDKNNGYCSSNMLFVEVSNSQQSLFNRYDIQNDNNLYYLCSKLFSKEFDFRRPHICQIGLLNGISIKNVALHMLGDPVKLYYSDYQKLAEKLQWANSTAYMVFSDIESDYIKVDSDLYVKSANMNIDEHTLDAVSKWLEKRLEKGFVSLITADYSELPEIEYEWNSHLMRSIIDWYLPLYKIIETSAKDRRYERGIILYKESEIEDYIDLIIWLMNKNNIIEISENKMLSLLVINGLTYKIIPKGLYMTDKLNYHDGTFSLK